MSLRSLWLATVCALSLPTLASATPPRRSTALQAHDGRVTIDLYDADLRNVLRLFADVGGVNLVVADDVSGRVTLKLARVHWRDALQVILDARGLEAEQRANILWVAPAATFAKKRAAQLTRHEQCLATAPLRTRLIRVSYADAASLAAHVQATLSPRGSVSVDARTNTLIVRDVSCTD